MRDDDCAYKKMKRDQKNRRWATGQSISHSLINLVPKEKKENLFLIFPYSFSFLLPAPVQLRTTIEHIRARLYLYVNTNAEAHFNTRSAIHTHRDNEMQSNHRPCSTDLIEKKNVHSRCVRRAYNTEEKKKKRISFAHHRPGRSTTAFFLPCVYRSLKSSSSSAIFLFFFTTDENIKELKSPK
jgi:hypothetical protein